MDIRNSFDGLRSLLGVNTTEAASTGARSSTAATTTVGGRDSAQVSSAGSQVSQLAAADTARPEKVAAVQAALAAGTYNVSASAVASKLVDAMLSGS